MDINRLTTAIIAILVVVVGGIVVLTTNDLSFNDYIKAVALGAGLLGIGYGLDESSRP